jgi:leucyl-tRNA synthetase
MPAKRETDTLDCFVASSWYFARYVDAHNKDVVFDRKKAEYWLPVDLYVGGPEHACKHLIYARFFMMVMKDMGIVRKDEPFSRLLTQGIVYKDGAKMSKSKGNTVSPDEIIDKYGADTGRMFILFAAPPETDLEWNDQGVEGAFRFLNRVWRLTRKVIEESAFHPEENSAFSVTGPDLPADLRELHRKVHLTIKKVTEDIGKEFHFNTAIAAMMELVNAIQDEIQEGSSVKIKSHQAASCLFDALRNLTLLLTPFAPHLAEEMWHMLGNTESVFKAQWPTYDPKAIETPEVEIVVQVNGKVRSRVTVPVDASEEDIKGIVTSDPKVKQYLGGKQIKKVIIVPRRLANVVV